ncbi:hypothetical protein IPH25_03755 [bacterium]|nr:MAG: hypothetical protein IPG37_00750 [bacterium]QQR61567.1 MAG: hypothetical protein IPH25_03755 [bacterium]QQR62897.1 MAG: hypothetical protein IPH67_00195 [bacterium]
MQNKTFYFGIVHMFFVSPSLCMFEEPVGCMFKMVEEKRYQRKWDQRNHDHFTFVISNCGNINKNYAERFNDREKGQASFTYLANQVGRTNIKNKPVIYSFIDGFANHFNYFPNRLFVGFKETREYFTGRILHNNADRSPQEDNESIFHQHSPLSRKMKGALASLYLVALLRPQLPLKGEAKIAILFDRIDQETGEEKTGLERFFVANDAPVKGWYFRFKKVKTEILDERLYNKQNKNVKLFNEEEIESLCVEPDMEEQTEDQNFSEQVAKVEIQENNKQKVEMLADIFELLQECSTDRGFLNFLRHEQNLILDVLKKGPEFNATELEKQSFLWSLVMLVTKSTDEQYQKMILKILKKISSRKLEVDLAVEEKFKLDQLDNLIQVENIDDIKIISDFLQAEEVKDEEVEKLLELPAAKHVEPGGNGAPADQLNQVAQGLTTDGNGQSTGAATTPENPQSPSEQPPSLWKWFLQAPVRFWKWLMSRFSELSF